MRVLNWTLDVAMLDVGCSAFLIAFMSTVPTDDPSPAPVKRDAYAAFRSPDYRSYAISGFITPIWESRCSGWPSDTRSSSARTRPRPWGWWASWGAADHHFLSIPAGIAADPTQSPGDHPRHATALRAYFGWADVPGARTPGGARHRAARRGHACLVLAGGSCAGEERGCFRGGTLPLMYLLLLINGISRAFGWAARSALFPNLVPRAALSNAVMWNSSNFELTCVVGPALGGFAIAWINIPTVYAIDAACALLGFLFILSINALARNGRIAPASVGRCSPPACALSTRTRSSSPRSRSISSPSCSVGRFPAAARSTPNRFSTSARWVSAGCAPLDRRGGDGPCARPSSAVEKGG